MTGSLFIAGDWGTSRLRLMLCDPEQMLECREGPGIAQLPAREPAVYWRTVADLAAPWIHEHGALPVWLSGMVGSRNGWVEVPYIDCPADADSIATAVCRLTAADHEVAIVPGLKCVNPRGAPDVLRGEETQVLGVLAQYPDLACGRHVIGLPGTHTKWVLMHDGRIVHFQTGFSGELFALLRDHSTLCRVSSSTVSTSGADGEFLRGAQRALELRSAPMSHLLFEVRSRQLVAAQEAGQALAFLSGLLIAQDVLGVLGLFAGLPDREHRIPLVGSAELTARYQVVLEALGMTAFCIEAEGATLSGLRAVVWDEGRRAAHAN